MVRSMKESKRVKHEESRQPHPGVTQVTGRKSCARRNSKETYNRIVTQDPSSFITKPDTIGKHHARISESS